MVSGFSRMYLVVLAASAAYFISALMESSNLTTLLAFPAVYLAPGLMLILLISRGRKLEIRQLVIMSFFLSTILAVVVVSTLTLLGVTICPYSIGATYMLLAFVLVVPAIMLDKPPQINASWLDCTFVSASLIAYVCLVCLFSSMPRLFTMDETTYITWSRYSLLNGETYPIGIWSARSVLYYLIKGRFFWTLLITSFLGSTGLKAYQAYLISPMFLSMIGITSTLLIPKKFKDNKLLEVAIFTLVWTNPLLLLFSGFVLNDLAVTFYLLLAILFFIRSFNQREQSGVSISLHGILSSFLSLIILFLIKENVVVIFGMYIILMFFILRYRLYEVSKTRKMFLYALTIPLIAYEVLIDIPYVVSVWFIKNEAVTVLTSRFILISPAEWLLGLFIPTTWNPTTLLSHDLYGYLHYLYRMLSPETLGLLMAGTGIALPLMLTLEGFRRDIQMRILVYASTITLWFTYFLYLSVNAFGDIPRFFLFMVPIFIATSLAALYEIFSNRNVTVGVALFLPSLFLLWVQSILSIEKRGVYVSYGLAELNWTGFMILVQLLVYVAVIAAISSPHVKSIIKVKAKWRKIVTVDASKVFFATLMITVVLSNAYFSVYSVNNSRYFEEHSLRDIEKLLSDTWSGDVFVVSNVYRYGKPYVPDDLLSHHYLIPPLMTEEEFIQLLKKLPNNTLILLSDNRNIASSEYANKDGYIFQYSKSSKIPVELKSERTIYDDVVLDLRFDSIDNNKITDYSENQHNVTVYGNFSLTQGVYGKALSFDSMDDYVDVSYSDSLNSTSAITVEIYVQFNVVPNSYCAIVSKGWDNSGAWVLGTTPEAKWQWAVKSQTGDCFKIESGSVVAGEWYHIVGVWDGSQLWLYVNGVYYGPINTTGNIGNTHDVLLGNLESLPVTSIWNCIIDEVRLYDKALSEEEILEMYHGPKLLVEEGELKLFRVETQGAFNVHFQSSNINVESVNIWWSNSTNVRLEVKANSLKSENVSVYLDTFQFLKILDLKLVRGENTIILDFPRWLSNGDKYGIYIANWANIAIVDSQGNLLYHNLHTPFTLKFPYIALWLLFILLLLTLLLVLTNKRQQTGVSSFTYLFGEG